MSHKTLNELVREQILAEGPQITDYITRKDYVDGVLNAMPNVELLDRISDAHEAIRRESLDHIKCWL